jgi:GT2 family glycosyltransferase
MKKPEVYLIICTRNRNELLLELLLELKHQEQLPTKIVIVDSSDYFIKIPKEVIDHINADRVIHFPSSPGLPFQRNQGINRIKSFGIEDDDLIAFLDDDIRPLPGYFRTIGEIAAKNKHIIGFTGVNLDISPKSSKMARFFLLGSKKQGKILKSGKTTPPTTKDEFEITDWAPGGSMNFRAKILKKISFRDEIRMYGEDLEFSLRLKKHGRILVVREAKYIHLKSTSGKDDMRTITKYSDLTQFLFAIEHPKYIYKICVFWSVLGMTGLNLKNILLGKNVNQNQKELRGHFDFYLSIINRKRLIQ